MEQLINEDPTHIGPYRLIARLGAGGMGLVYLGRSDLGRTVAVKVVQAEYAEHPEFRRRFAREVAAARLVGGHWTAAVLDADPEAAVPWVATQYIPGPDLQTVVGTDFGPLPEYSVHTLANRLAAALQAIHGAGLIHRDLKPSNVLVTVDGPRVIDFGIARAMDSLAGDSLHTHTGMLIGSPGFMSPEQVRGLELTPASDVFCLGAVLVHAATGRFLFGARDTGLNAHLFRIAEEEADLTGVPESLVDLVAACLHKDPARRPAPEQVAARTATDRTTEWLPGPVLAQLGRHAAELLDFAPEVESVAPVVLTAAPVADAVAPALPPMPAYAPSAPVSPGQFGPPPPGFGPPPAAFTGYRPGPLPPTTAEDPASFADYQDPAPAHPRRWWGLAVVALAQLLVLLQAGSFTIAFPAMERDLHLTSDSLSAMTNAYPLAFLGLLLLGGHLADLLGRKQLLIVGLVGFAAASVLAGTAGDATTLDWARTLQGVSAALLAPAALSLVAGNFTDPRERRRALGVYTAIVGGGSLLGLYTGGWLVENLDWQWALMADVPVAAVVLVGALTLLHDRPARTGTHVDVLGVLLGCGGLAVLGYGLTYGVPHGWTSLAALLPLAAGVLLLVAFLWWQTVTSTPLLARYVFMDRGRAGSLLAMLPAAVGVIGPFTALVYVLQLVLGYSPAGTGLALLPVVAALFVGSTQVSPRLLHRVGARALVAAGLGTAAVGLLLLTGLTIDSGYESGLLPGLVLVGLGTGVAFMPLFATATGAANPRCSGAASAAVVAAQQLGVALGAALLTRVFNAHSHLAADTAVAVETAALHGCSATLWWAFGATLLAGLVGGLVISGRASKQDRVPAAR